MLSFNCSLPISHPARRLENSSFVKIMIVKQDDGMRRIASFAITTLSIDVTLQFLIVANLPVVEQVFWF